MIYGWPKKGFIYFLLMLNFYVCSMDQDVLEEDNSSSSTDQEVLEEDNSNSSTIEFQTITEEIVNSERVPPLEILLEKEDLNVVLVLACRLRERQIPNKGLLLHGPAGCGKFSIAWNICLIAQFEFAAVEACDLLNEKESQKGNVKALFDVLNKNSSLILFIYNFEDLINNQGEFLSKFARSFVNFKRANSSVFLVGSTRCSEISENPDVISLFRTLNVGLPSYQLRERILLFYSNKNRIGERCADRKYLIYAYLRDDSLVTACRGLSGSDIKEIVESAAIAAQENLKNNYSGLFWYKMKNNWDWKDRKFDSVVFFTLLSYSIFPYAAFCEGIESNREGCFFNHLFGFCKRIQQQNAVNRTIVVGLMSKFRWLAANSALLKNYIATPIIFVIKMGLRAATGGASAGFEAAGKIFQMTVVPLADGVIAGAAQVVKDGVYAECDKELRNRSSAYKKFKEKEEGEDELAEVEKGKKPN